MCAAGTGEIANVDADVASFQIDAVLTGRNIALRLGDDSAAAAPKKIPGGAEWIREMIRAE